MHSRFDQFRGTGLGRQLEAIIDTPGRYIEFAALSRAEVPAVAAIVHDLVARFPEIKGDQTARQFCGAMVAEVMRRHHHEILRPRGRVIGELFTYGAVWTAEPQRVSFEALLASLLSMPDQVLRLIDTIPEQYRRIPPEGTGFSLIEHVCHLLDLDHEVYADRIERVLQQDGPVLLSVDGVAMAAERQYRTQNLNQAMTAFRASRTSLVDRLSATTVDQRGRWGLFDSVRRVTIFDLVHDIHHHDRTHLQEIEELAVEVVPAKS